MDKGIALPTTQELNGSITEAVSSGRGSSTNPEGMAGIV